MRRYWVDAHSITNEIARIDGNVFHHIFSVCRQEVGSVFELLSGNNTAVVVEVLSVGKKSAEAKVLETRVIPPLPLPHIHLALSIPRFPVMDAVVEKAVEMGVHSLHPFFSEYSFVRKSSSVPDGKEDRWKKIVVSATQQCGRGELMTIHPPVDLQKIWAEFNRTKACVGLFAYEGKAERNIREYLRGIPKAGLTEVWVFVGSEGGFSSEEVKQFQELGMEPVTLGEQVLRVETACITLSAVLKYEFELF
jgi:16S rRNA (uracil1498-N3)-methyltransferase